jgi:hypothetical protein
MEASAVGPADAGAMEAAMPGDAALDARDGSDSAVVVQDASGDGGLSCPGDISAPPYVNITPTVVVGTAPAFTGGTIADGVYVLTSYVAYDSVDDGGCSTMDPGGGGFETNAPLPLSAVTFSAGMFRIEHETPPDGGVGCVVEPYMISGTSIVLGADGGDGSLGYSISADGLTLELYLGGCSDNGVVEGSVGTLVRQ